MRKFLRKPLPIIWGYVFLLAAFCTGGGYAQTANNLRLPEEGKKTTLRVLSKAQANINGDAPPSSLAEHLIVIRKKSPDDPQLLGDKNLRSATSEDPRVEPYTGGLPLITPSLMTNEIILKRPRGLSDHRREPSVSSSPGFKRLSDGIQKPMGDAAAALACRRAQFQLSDFGLGSSEFKASMDPHAKTAETNFAKACLEPVSDNAKLSQVAALVGRLQSDAEVSCTVTLIKPDIALTARHCFFEVTESANGKSMIASLRKGAFGWTVNFGSIDAPQKANITSIHIPSALDGKNSIKVVPSNTSWSGPIDKAAKTADYILVKLDVPLNLSGSIDFSGSHIQIGSELHLLGYYPGHNLAPVKNDSGIRHQPAGLCKALAVGAPRCIMHACATSQGASGAPIFLLISGELKLAAIHSSASNASDICESPITFQNSTNYAVELFDLDLSQL